MLDNYTDNDLWNMFASELSGMEILLFHGSNMTIDIPKANFENSNKKADFGEGFYTTEFYEQAVRWAYRKAGNYGGIPTVNVYAFDQNAVGIYDFGNGYTREWLRFVAECRKNGRTYKLDDVIRGGVADDKVIKTIDDYLKGYVSEDSALDDLEFSEKSNQCCFTDNASIRKSLRFLDTIEN